MKKKFFSGHIGGGSTVTNYMCRWDKSNEQLFHFIILLLPVIIENHYSWFGRNV